VAVLVLAFTGAMAPSAWATLEIQSNNNPAGDPTVHSYALYNGDGTRRAGLKNDENPFPLLAGERRSVGPPGGTGGTTIPYIWQAIPAAGWKVGDIQCLHVDPATGNAIAIRPGEFAIDVANGRVTINHREGDDEYCAFTNVKISAPAGGGTTGVSPTLPGTVTGSQSTGATALLRVVSGLHFAQAQVRIARQSVIRLQLLKGKKVVGTARFVRKAGTPTLKVTLARKYRRSYQRQGLKRVTLTLKITIVGNNKFTKVFRYGVVVRL
jgi:hypothetical protein